MALYKGKHLCLIDWKTSGKAKPNLRSTYENPLQVAAYVGALNHDPAYNVEVLRGCIVIVYNDGAKANVLEIPQAKLKKYWDIWRDKLQMYNRMREYTENN